MFGKIKKVCPHCGSYGVTLDALVRWSFENQDWEFSSALNTADCDDCGYHFSVGKIVDQVIEPQEAKEPSNVIEQSHEHREPTAADFVGKTVARFDGEACNEWKIWFTDGTAFAIHADLFHDIPIMELCEACATDEETGA